MKNARDAREDAKEKDDEEYVAFPGGIPKRWLNPAVAIFLFVSPFYTAWVVIMQVRSGMTAGTPAVDIAGAIWTHLSEFLFGFPILILIICKILERIMYYLDVKKLNAEYRQRLDEQEQSIAEAIRLAGAAEQRAEATEQRAEAAEQRAEAAIRRAEAAEQRAEAAEQRADDYQQSAESYRHSADSYRESAEIYRQRLEEAEAEKDRRA